MLAMSTVNSQIREILDWIGNDPFRDALLIAEAPIGRTTLAQLKSGKFVPSIRLLKALLSVKEQFPEGIPEYGGQKATGT